VAAFLSLPVSVILPVFTPVSVPELVPPVLRLVESVEVVLESDESPQAVKMAATAKASNTFFIYDRLITNKLIKYLIFILHLRKR
jgi:hypothetical protein